MTDIFNIPDTWADGGTTFDGIKIDVTNTASADASKLLDLQVGSVSKFSVNHDGALAPDVRTAGEIAASVTPVDYNYPPHNVLRYGVNTTPGTTDMHAAFKAAHDSFDETGDNRYGAQITVPRGIYFLSATWVIEKRVIIKGEGHGEQSDTAGSQLFFPADTHGIRLHSSVTDDSPAGTSAAHSVIEDIGVYCNDRGGSSSGHGIFATCNVYLNRVGVRQFAGHGIAIIANGSGQVGSANKWQVSHCFVKSVDGDCFHVDGSDTNAGFCLGCDFSDSPTGWGIYEFSTLGNTYIGCHMSSSGLGCIKTRANASNVFLGTYVEQAGGKGHEIVKPSFALGGIGSATINYPELAITGDGSGATGVCRTGSGAVAAVQMTNYGSGYTTAAATSSGGGGSGATYTPNIVSGEITSVTVTAGGTGHADGDTARTMMVDNNWKFQSPIKVEMIATGTYGTVEIGADDVPITIDMVGLGNPLQLCRWNESRRAFEIKMGSNISQQITTSDSSLFTGGRSAALAEGNIHYPGGFWIGTTSTARQIDMASSIPTSGEYAKGDRVLNTNTSVVDSGTDDYVITGWIRLVTGTSHVLNTDWAEMRSLTGT